MKNHNFAKLFSSFLAFVMVLSLLMPYSAHANSIDEIDGKAAETETLKTKPFKQNSQDESILQQKAAIAEQLSVLGGEARLHDDLKNVTGSQEVPIIIHFSERSVGLETGIKKLAGKTISSTEANQVKQKVRNQQISAKKEMAIKGIKFQEGFSYDTVLNGISGSVKADDLPKLLEVTGVVLVEPDTIVYAQALDKGSIPKKPIPSDSNLSDKLKDATVGPAMDTSISFLGIEKLWAEGYEGQGIKVAVLDTGIDADHPDFKGIYKGGKNFVPHTGNDYTRPRADDDASETSPVERPSHRPEFNDRGNSFYTSHGTHVAGTIAAIGNNEYGIKGIAPKVDLYAYRVLGAYGSGATSGIIKAIDTAVIEGMDVINLSLGGGSNSETDGASFAINNAMLAGTISVIATGNSGPNRGTMGTPSTSRLGIAVANTTNPEAHYDGHVNITVGDYNLSKQLNIMGTTYGQDLSKQLDGEYDIVAVPNIGAEADYAGIDVNGKVALVARGDIAFVDKIAAAKNNGAVAMIVHNFAGGTNAPGPSGTFLGDDFEFIPTFDMSQTDGEAIRAALKNAEGKISFSQFNQTITAGDEVNNSSSRGPSTPNFDIKPDVSAPGTNIMSTIPMYKADFPEATYDQAYTRKTGTSMATPHVAGIAALVKQANPNWDAFDVKVALSNTAKILDTKKYDVFDQGAGRVQAYAAAHPEILAYAIDTANNDGETVENLKGTVTFGPQPLNNDVNVTKQILVKNHNGNGGTYNATVEVIKGFGDATVTIDKPSFTLSSEQLLNVTLKASKNPNAEHGAEILGYIHITGGDTPVSLPFAADFGGEAATQLKDMEITETDLSFNGDGVKDEAMLYFTITGDVGLNLIEIWDIMDPEGGVYGDGYIGYLHAGTSLGAGSYQLRIGGTYKPWSDDPQTKIPDGLYTIDYTAQTVSGNPPVIGDYVGPIVVKSEAGTIEGALEGKTVTGKIDDAYIGYQKELVDYGLGYDINTKLKASYEVVAEEKVIASGQVKLEQDGTFSFELPELDKAKHSIIVKYEDAAGNKAEEIVYKAGDQVDGAVEYKLSDESVTLKPNENTKITVTETTTKPDGTTEEKDVTEAATFTSSDEKVATAEKGLITAVAAGTAEITVQYEEFTATIAVEVTEDPQGEDKVTYSVSKTNVTLGVGQQEQLFVTETTTKADGTVIEKDVTGQLSYNVVNNKFATIHKGLITAKAPGKTQARIMIPNEETIYVYLEVTAVPQDIVTYSVNKKNMTLGVGQQEQLYVTETTVKPDGTVIEKDVTGNLRYNVVNNTYATVQKGLVTARAAGKTQVRIQIPDEEAIYVYLEVTELPQDIVTYTTNKTNLSIGVGQQEQLYVTETTVKPDGTVIEKDVTGFGKYNVIDNTVATVKKGLVTGLKAGNSQVRIIINDKETLYVYVEVKQQPQDVISYELNQTDMKLEVGQQEQLKVTKTTVKPDGSTTQKDATVDARFNVVNKDIASVQRGLVTAKQAGKTQVRVVMPDGDVTLVYLEVTGQSTPPAAPDVITYAVNKTETALNVGDTDQLTVTETTTKADGNQTEKDVTATSVFTTADPSIATVENGVVTAVGAGETAITITNGDFTATVQVTVTETAQNTITYTVNQTEFFLTIGETGMLEVSEVTNYADGTNTMLDITADASYSIADDRIAIVDRGTIIALNEGRTEITVKYGDFIEVITVNVAANTEQPAKHIITEDSIPSKGDIFINLSSSEEEIDVEMSQAVLQAIVDNKNELFIQKGSATFTFDRSALQELQKTSFGDVTITFGSTYATDSNAVSDVYTIAIYDGTGDSKQLNNGFNKKIEATVPVDESKITKKAKVHVMNYYTNERVENNAKVYNGTVNFRAKEAGAFYAIAD